MDSRELASDFDAVTFRAVMGHYPTGVVVVTARADDGSPLGMVVGSFTSVSIDPPLIAFFPDRSSSTYARLQGPRPFVINVLAADQEHLCRRFSSKAIVDKWAGVEYEIGPDAIPVLSGAVAHIACQYESSQQAGDHDIVVGRVTDLCVVNPVLPLLFFQGGYGRFATASLVMRTEADLIGPIRAADAARGELEQLAQTLGRTCVVQAAVGPDLVLVASAGQPIGQAPTRVGQRVPHVPPFGAPFIAWAAPEAVENWLATVSTKVQEGGRSLVLEGLERVRGRGWSIAISSPSHQPFREAANAFSSGHLTPQQERDLLLMTSQLSESYEPSSLDLPSDTSVRLLAAPVFGPDGTVELALQLWDLQAGLTAERIKTLAAQLVASADRVSQVLRRDRDRASD